MEQNKLVIVTAGSKHAIGETTGDGRVRLIGPWHDNLPNLEMIVKAIEMAEAIGMVTTIAVNPETEWMVDYPDAVKTMAEAGKFIKHTPPKKGRK